MTIGLLAASLAIASGAFVGLTLGLIGGGGSVLAVPLLVYLVLVALASIVLYRMVEVPSRRWLRGLTGSAASISARRSKDERLVS